MFLRRAPLLRRAAIGALAAILLLAPAVCAGPASASSGLRAGSQPASARNAAAPMVPPGFVGMNIDGPVFNPALNLGHQLDTMASSGVETLRVTVNWSAMQPYASFKALHGAGADGTGFDDVNGVPTDFSAIDAVVQGAATRGLRLLPVVIYTPGWDASKHTTSQFARPQRNGPYVDFLKALIRRYGPNGTFWSANPGTPKLPVRMWQIWNEPSLPSYWPDRPFEKTYVALLHAAHAGIKSADPGAKVVLAGLPNFSWQQLKPIYRVPGARASFDVVAIHPYTAKPPGVITILRFNRAVMDQYGDASKPILATEVGWPSSLGEAPQSVGTTEAGQARNIAAVLPLLARYRVSLNLLGFDIYDWMGVEYRGAAAYSFAGLFRFNPMSDKVVAKPAYSAFRRAALAIEGCRTKGAQASNCTR